MLLAGRTVLLVDPDARTLEWLAEELKAHGARSFPARDAATAVWGARETLPDLVVSELELGNVEPHALLAELRDALGPLGLGALALSANAALLEASRRREHGFDKYLGKPAASADLVDALCSLLGHARSSERGAELESRPTLDTLNRFLGAHDYRGLLAHLNAASDHRFGALFRREGVRLRNVWTHDREQPQRDRFPELLPLASTPCDVLFAERRPLRIADATVDPRLGPEHVHAAMRAFAGVPLAGEDGALVGALCLFDPEPRTSSGDVLDSLERVAKLFHFHQLKARPR